LLVFKKESLFYFFKIIGIDIIKKQWVKLSYILVDPIWSKKKPDENVP
jgi:hypothetical protein